MTDFPVHGTVAPGFETVRSVFERNFSDDIEVGASFCAIVDGETVADLWGGLSGPRVHAAVAAKTRW